MALNQLIYYVAFKNFDPKLLGLKFEVVGHFYVKSENHALKSILASRIQGRNAFDQILFRNIADVRLFHRNAVEVKQFYERLKRAESVCFHNDAILGL